MRRKLRPTLTVVPISHKCALETEIHLEKLIDMSRSDDLVGIVYVALRSDGTSFGELAGRARQNPLAAHAMAVELAMKTRVKLMSTTAKAGLLALALGVFSSLVPDGPGAYTHPTVASAAAEDDDDQGAHAA